MPSAGAPRGAASARLDEADVVTANAFEAEYPGSSWLASRALRAVEVAGSSAAAMVAVIARKYGLTHAALNALAVIEGAGGPLPAGEVSARMHITTATTTSVLDTLERNGYVTRRPNPDDRRSVLVDITPDAQAILDRVLPEVQLAARTVFATFDNSEISSLLDQLELVLGTIRSFDGELPAPPVRVAPSSLRRGR